VQNVWLSAPRAVPSRSSSLATLDVTVAESSTAFHVPQRSGNAASDVVSAEDVVDAAAAGGGGDGRAEQLARSSGARRSSGRHQAIPLAPRVRIALRPLSLANAMSPSSRRGHAPALVRWTEKNRRVTDAASRPCAGTTAGCARQTATGPRARLAAGFVEAGTALSLFTLAAAADVFAFPFDAATLFFARTAGACAIVVFFAVAAHGAAFGEEAANAAGASVSMNKALRRPASVRIPPEEHVSCRAFSK